MCKKIGAEVLFVGDDWYGTEKWKSYEEAFKKEKIKIVYFPYTKRNIFYAYYGGFT